MLDRHAGQITGTVVDLGCGDSPYRRYFKSADRYLRMDRYPLDDEVIIADATDIPVEDESVQALLLGRMLGDLPDLVAAFTEFARVLVPGGKILIYESMTYPQHDLPHDYWRVMPNGLRWVATQAGLEVELIRNLGGYFTQLGMHWNQFLLAPLGHYRVFSPVTAALRASGNLIFRGLDRIWHRSDLASDYFACVVKPLR